MKERVFVFFVGLILGICLMGYWVIRNIAYADHLVVEDIKTHQSRYLK